MDTSITINGDIFECQQDLIDASSLHRPDVGWIKIDSSGHTHQWHADGKPVTSYRPDIAYEIPSLVWVKDGEEYYPDDDEPHDVGHHECRECHQRIEPAYTADHTRQYISGLRHYQINHRDVSPDEFDKRLAEAKSKIHPIT